MAGPVRVYHSRTNECTYLGSTVNCYWQVYVKHFRGSSQQDGENKTSVRAHTDERDADGILQGTFTWTSAGQGMIWHQTHDKQ